MIDLTGISSYLPGQSASSDPSRQSLYPSQRRLLSMHEASSAHWNCNSLQTVSSRPAMLIVSMPDDHRLLCRGPSSGILQLLTRMNTRCLFNTATAVTTSGGLKGGRAGSALPLFCPSLSHDTAKYAEKAILPLPFDVRMLKSFQLQGASPLTP